jgi:hypothetical protein
MIALVAAVALAGTPAANPAPPTGNPLVHSVLDNTLYLGGYAEGFAAGRDGKLPVAIFT